MKENVLPPVLNPMASLGDVFREKDTTISRKNMALRKLELDRESMLAEIGQLKLKCEKTERAAEKYLRKYSEAAQLIRKVNQENAEAAAIYESRIEEMQNELLEKDHEIKELLMQLEEQEETIKDLIEENKELKEELQTKEEGAKTLRKKVVINAFKRKVSHLDRCSPEIRERFEDHRKTSVHHRKTSVQDQIKHEKVKVDRKTSVPHRLKLDRIEIARTASLLERSKFDTAAERRPSTSAVPKSSSREEKGFSTTAARKGITQQMKGRRL